jgi:hypothetical protein
MMAVALHRPNTIVDLTTCTLLSSINRSFHSIVCDAPEALDPGLISLFAMFDSRVDREQKGTAIKYAGININTKRKPAITLRYRLYCHYAAKGYFMDTFPDSRTYDVVWNGGMAGL